MNKTLVVIFCFNVENHIPKIIKTIKSKRIDRKKDFLFIDDCSKDKTNLILKKNKINNAKIIKNKKNQGFGKNYKFSINYSLKKGYKNLIFLHGDNQYPPQKIKMIEKKLDKSSLVYGSRKLNFSSMKKNMPLMRLIANLFLTYMINIFLKSNATEFFSGFRGIKVEKLKNLNLKEFSDKWIIEQQIHFEFIKKKFKISEISIPTVYEDNQKSEIPPIRYVCSVIYNVLKYSLK